MRNEHKGQSPRAIRRARWSSPLIVTLLVASLSVGSCYAIVKQARNDDTQSQSQQQQSSQLQQQQQQQQQSQQAASSSSLASSISSSSSSSSSSSAPSSGSSSISQAISSGASPSSSISGSMGNANQLVQNQYQTGYQNHQAPSSGQSYAPKQSSSGSQSYSDQGIDQNSYQAAAQSVNMALANSGFFGSTGSQGSSANQQQQQQQQTSQISGLNPLHYYYYPAKDGSSNAGQQANQKSAVNTGLDMMSSASSSIQNNYQPYPSYSDQLSGSGSGNLQPDVAASGQEPAYLPQPNGPNQMDAHYGGQQQGSGGQSMGQPGQQDLMSGLGFGSGQQQGSPNNNNNQMNYNQPPQQQQQPMMGQSGAGSGSHVSFGGISSPSSQSDFFNQGASLYSQLGGDLAASSQFGSVSQQQQQPGQQQQQQQQQSPSSSSMMSSYLASLAASNQQPGGQSASGDLFGSQPFSSAASQLSASSVPPPLGHQVYGQQAGAISGLSGSPTANSGLFSNQNSHYLNSFLSSAAAAAASNGGSVSPSAGSQQVSQIYHPFTSLLGGSGNNVDQSMAGSQGSLLTAAGSGGPISAASNTSKRFGLSTFIMPMLALAGLSLLIPTMSNIGTAVGRRKKRSVSELATGRQQQIGHESVNGVGQVSKELSIPEYLEKIERYYAIYQDAVVNDDCMNRLICEFGDAVKDLAAGRATGVTIIEKLVPNWMTGKVHLFKEAALESKEGKERCKKYICNTAGSKRAI